MRRTFCLLFASIIALAGCAKGGGSPTSPPPPGGSDQDRFVLIGDNYDLVLRDLSAATELPLTSDSSATEDYNATFSPSGGQIVWQRYGAPGQAPYTVWIMNRDGTGKTKLADGFLGQVGACSPQGRVLIWQRRTPALGDRIRIVDLAGNTVDTVADDTTTKYLPEWSPTGDRIAFIAGLPFGHPPQSSAVCDVYVINADGSNLQQLTNTAAPEKFLRWSPDGTRLAIVRIEGSLERLYVHTLATGTELLIADVTWGSGRHYPVYAAWSADGTRLIYRRAVDGHVVATTLGTGAIQDISLEPASQPCLSAGGLKLAFTSDAGWVVVAGSDGSNRLNMHASTRLLDVEAFW